MKNIFLLALALTLFTACKEEESSINETPFFKATLNDEAWQGDLYIAQSTTDDSVTISARGFEEEVYFRIKLTNEGIYELTGEQAIYYTTVGQDAVTSRYTIDTEKESFVTITKYNQDQKVIEGTFNLYLDKEWGHPTNEIEAVNFINGQFKGEITYYE